jgi:hypothetical protein
MGFIRKWKQHGHKVGKFDQSGNKIDNINKAEAYSGQLYGSREEAVDLRTSEGVETKKDNKSVFGGKRANLFGN